MSVDQLRRFLVEVQGEENATLEDAQSLMDSLKHLNIFHRRGFNLETFFKYLFGDVNPPLNPKLGVSFFLFTCSEVWISVCGLVDFGYVFLLELLIGRFGVITLGSGFSWFM